MAITYTDTHHPHVTRLLVKKGRMHLGMVIVGTTGTASFVARKSFYMKTKQFPTLAAAQGFIASKFTA